MGKELPSLQVNTTDYVASLAKGAFGVLPVIGPVTAEIIGHIIPNQRIDRIVRLVEMLEQRVRHLEHEPLRERWSEPDAVDLIEDALFLAARAKSDERLEYIAEVVARGLTDEERNEADAGKMLWLLERLNDVEIILLRGRLPRSVGDFDKDAEFQEEHADNLRPRTIVVGSPREDIEQDAIRSSYHQHLLELGLLKSTFRTPGGLGDLPEFDHKTGMMATNGQRVTILGRMFLEFLDLIPAWATKE